MRRDTDKLEAANALLNTCTIFGALALLVLLLAWNTVGMTMRVVFIAVGLLMILGLYKAVRILAKETADEVEFDKEKVSHYMDLDIRKTRILIAVNALIICMIVGVLALFLILPIDDDTLLCDLPMRMWIWIIVIAIMFLLLCLGKDKADKELERLLAEYKFFGRNAIRISFAGNGNAPLPAGCSKYGGRPDVPDDFQWPHDNSDRPLSLLLQIDCADLAPLDREGLLPASGQLYFFYELSKMNRGGQKNAVRVIYNDKPSSQLHPLDYPVNLGKKYQLQECRLQFIRCTSFPKIEELGLLTSFNDDEDKSEYYGVFNRSYDKFWKGDGPIGKMLGYADLIQGPIVNDLANEVLLLELYSSENWQEDDKTPHDVLFSDGGCIYFYIKREDLLARRFDSIKFAFQCD